MKTLKTLGLMIFFPLSLLLTACSSSSMMTVPTNNGATANDQPPATSQAIRTKFSVVPAGDVKFIEPDKLGYLDPTVIEAAEGANDFAFRLSAALIETLDDKNFVCSPYSMWLPLAALASATDLKYQNQLFTALGVPNISADDLNRAASLMLYDLTKQYNKVHGSYEYYNPLKITNVIFASNDTPFKNVFTQNFANYYHGSLINVDFSSPGVIDTVNHWVSEHTEGLTKNLVAEFKPDTISAIANAIYFSDRWAREFNPQNTKKDFFHALSGDQSAFFMTRTGDGQLYYEDENVQAVPLQFKNNGGLYILLPKTGSASEFLKSMTSEYFEKIQYESELLSGTLTLPRFRIENNIVGLKETLAQLGVPLFNKDFAALTGGLIEGDAPVFLSDAMQNAIIDVDEKGTTAAAVNIVPATMAGMPEQTAPFEMICDKPFVFILYDRSSHIRSQILFTGLVNNPLF